MPSLLTRRCVPGAQISNVTRARIDNLQQRWLQPQIVLLDVGMATEMSDVDQRNMIGLFQSFAAMDGHGVGKWTLAFSGARHEAQHAACDCVCGAGFATGPAFRVVWLLQACWVCPRHALHHCAAPLMPTATGVRNHPPALPVWQRSRSHWNLR